MLVVLLIVVTFTTSTFGQLRLHSIDGSKDSNIDDKHSSMGSYLNPGRHHFGRSYGQTLQTTTDTYFNQMFQKHKGHNHRQMPSSKSLSLIKANGILFYFSIIIIFFDCIF